MHYLKLHNFSKIPLNNAWWCACAGCRQSKYPLPGRASELVAVSRLRPRAAVGLSTRHTTLRAHVYKLGHTHQCGDTWEQK
jgi:hypothetical protein